MSSSEIAELFGTPWAILLAVVFLGASIFVHELGHFLAARWRGLVVDRFSIGFGPRIFGWRRNGVDWRISAIPVGGYVSLPQLAGMRMIEGNPDLEGKELPPLSYSDKVIVSAAGAVFNVLFALLIGTVLWYFGRPADASEQTTVVGYVPAELSLGPETVVPGPAYKAGIRPGDRIVAIDGKAVHEWMDISRTILTGSGHSPAGHRRTTVTIERNGELISVNATPEPLGPDRLRTLGLFPAQRARIGVVTPGSPAEAAGLRVGDEVVAIDGQPVYNAASIGTALSAEPLHEHLLTIRRGGDTIDVPIKAQPALYRGERVNMVGVTWAPGERMLVHENPLQQVAAAVDLTFTSIGALLNPRSDVGLRHMSGPVGIVHAFVLTVQEGLGIVLFLTLLINVNLAIVNLLPIPVLDGGHILFATIEKVGRRSLPPAVMATTQNAFVALILCMFLYITFNDIGRVFRGGFAGADDPGKPVFLDESGE